MPSGARGQIVPDLALWSQATRIGGGITPSRVSAIIREADTGESRRLIDLANECRQRDAHLQAVLATSEESIASLPWQVVPTDAKPRAKDKRAAEWVTEVLRGLPGFQRLIADLAGAVYYSFACDEIAWKNEGGRLIPDRFVHVAPRRFRFRTSDGRLVLHDDGEAEVVLEEQYPNKFIFSRPRVTGDVPTREGLMRVLVWMSVMRNWALADWLKTGELSWKPWRIGTYKKQGTSPEDIAALESVMRRLTTDFSAVIPDTCSIAIEWPGGTSTRNSTHAEICAALAGEQSKATLGQTETTESSASSGYAQAKVHREVKKDLRDARARHVATDLTRDLIGAMIRLNFGTSVKVPRLEFITQDPIDLKGFSDAVKTFKDATLRMPEKWVREQAGIPEPQNGEDILGGGVAGEKEEVDGGVGDDENEEPNDEQEPDPEAEDQPPAAEDAGKKRSPGRRPRARR
jgi:phage gp29-like protein